MSNGVIPTGFEIDHIDGNSLNNKIENLRLATHTQQAFNTAEEASNAYNKIAKEIHGKFYRER